MANKYKKPKRKLKITLTLDFNKLTRGLDEVKGYCSEEEKHRIDNFLVNLEELKTKYRFPIEKLDYLIEEERTIKSYKVFDKSNKMGSVCSITRTFKQT